MFLSHSWQNKPAAHKVVEALATERLPCWLDEQQLDYGAELRAALMSAIAKSDIYLYLVSDAANNSKWVRDELEYAVCLEFDKKLKIVPVRLAGISQNHLTAINVTLFPATNTWVASQSHNTVMRFHKT